MNTPMKRKATTMEKCTSKDVLYPVDPQSSSGSGDILSGQVISSKLMEETLHLNLKITPSESFSGDGPTIFKAFVHGDVICTKVLAKVLPAVTVNGGERNKKGNQEVVLQNDTLLSFSVVAREMISLRGDAGLDLNTDRTSDEKFVKPGQYHGDGSDDNTSIRSAMGDNCDGVGDITSSNESDGDTLTDDCDTKIDTTIKDTQQPCAVPAMHKCKVCGTEFEHMSMLTKHQLTHANYKYACSFGCRAFTTKHQLVKHMTIHTRTREHICNICSRAFFDASSLDTHQCVHSDNKPFKCMHCEKAYTMNNTLQRHIARLHAEFLPDTQQNMRIHTGTSTTDEISVKSEKFDNHDGVVEINKTEEYENVQENIEDTTSSTEDCTSTVEPKSETCTKSMSIDLPQPKRRDMQCPESISILQHKDSERNEDKSDHDTLIDNGESKNDSTTKETRQPAMYDCTLCGKEFEHMSMLTKHQLAHEKYKYACSFGCRAFAFKHTLVTHMKMHTRTRDHICKICSKAFFSASSLRSHQFIHSTEKPFKCAHCDKAYTMRNSLKMHVSRDHAKPRPNTHCITRKHKHDPEHHKYACSFGCRAFATKQQLAIHMAIHTRTRDHICKICSKAFFNAGSLETHQFVHSAEKPFKCTHCDKSYTMNYSLKKHALTHQAEFQRYKCDICGRMSSSKHIHERHLLTHSNVEVFQCEFCGKQFKSKSILVSHERIHKGYTKFQCDQCDRSYLKRQYLEVHKKTHTGEDLLQCEVCGDWFSDPDYFKRHQRVYCKGKLNIQCEICGQSFPDNRYLVSHMGLHSGERPFGCDVCGKAFAKPEALSDHMKRHNPKSDFRCRFCGRFCISKSELRKHEVRHRQRKLHARLPDEMKPGCYRPEPTIGRGETSKPVQAVGTELCTPGIEEIVFTDTSGGSGGGHQQMVSIGDGGGGDQRPQPNVVGQSMVIYVSDGVGADQIPQSMAIYIDHAV